MSKSPGARWPFGAFDYVVKPVDFTYLTTSLQTLMTMKAIDAPDA